MGQWKFSKQFNFPCKIKHRRDGTMRTTQYIGLTPVASKYAATAINSEKYEMTLGMFEEPVMGKIYYMPVSEGPNKALIAKEVVQAEPWSSGPMIFTHLQLTLIKESGQEIDCGFVGSWVEDPLLKCEVNYTQGTYYV